jgi:haloalkane dehalogenase
VWGTQDPFFKEPQLEKWQKRLPQSEVYRLECGHFIQEEKTQEAIEKIRTFIAKK